MENHTACPSTKEYAIALLSCIDQVMERMQLARLKFLTGPLHPSIVGGLEGKSTSDAVETVVGMASDACYNRSGPRTLNLMHCYAIFIDYKKAFELADLNSTLHLLAVDKGKVLSASDRSLPKDRDFKITMVAYADDFVIISNHADVPHLLSSALSKLETVYRSTLPKQK